MFTVDGRTTWFESRDVPIAASHEAFGSALLVPALHSGRALRIEGPVCEGWAANMQRLTDEFRRLWYPDHARPLIVAERDQRPRVGGRTTALCFSGGVDAFHTLIASGIRIDRLVYVAGYDVKLRQQDRLHAIESMLRDVAGEIGCSYCVIRTNLRSHPLVRATPWLREFGGALAAVAHLLADHCERVLISSDGLGFAHAETGSRASTDPLFSSGRVEIQHTAPAATRLEKVRAIAGSQLVQRHLRVCWKNVGSLMNCGQCEKCIRTMVTLEACGVLEQYEGFGRGRGLEAAIDRLPAVDDVVESFYRGAIAGGLSSRVDGAVRRLLERTADAGWRLRQWPSHGPLRRLARAARDRVMPKAWRWAVAQRPRAQYRLLCPAAFAPVMQPLLGKSIGYVRPEGNVGDNLIEVAMVQLFAEYGVRWRRWRPDVTGDTDGIDILVFGGGGNMGSRYIGNFELRTRALSAGVPVVVLPQSFTSNEDRPFTKVFVREHASLALCPAGTLAPDLALGLQTVELPRARRELGVFLRRDQERVGRKSLVPSDPVRWFRDPMDYLLMASRYRRIVTDRLHFAMAGLHAGRDVTLLANDYHKNRSMHETWLAALGCKFAESWR